MKVLLCYFCHQRLYNSKAFLKILLKRGWLHIVCLLLVGCSSFLVEKVPCPKTAILAEFSKSLEIKKGIPIRTEIDSITPHCHREADYIFMGMRLRFTSLRPFLSTHTVATIHPSYFIAILDKEGQLLSRTDRTLEVNFVEKQTTKVSFESAQVKVPLQPGTAVYVGFSLDEAQLDLLRKEREKKPYDHRPQSH